MKAKRSTWGLLCLWGLSFLFSNLSIADTLLRTGVLKNQDGTKSILLGIASPPSSSRPSFDFYELGFEGYDLSHIDPKFLLEMDSNQFLKVRAFETDDFERDGFFLKPPKARCQKVGHVAVNTLSFFGKTLGFPFSTTTILSDIPRHNREKRHKIQAYYLLELINQALPPSNRFPSFLEAVSDSPEDSKNLLRELGEAILLRYNPKSNWAGLHTPLGNCEFFEQWRNVQSGFRTENQGYVVRLANEKDFRVELFGNDFAIVYFRAHPNLTEKEVIQQIEALKFMGLGLEIKDSQAILTLMKTMPLQKETFVPWYLVSFVNPEGPVDLVNFIQPELFSKELHHRAKELLFADISGSLAPFTHWLSKGLTSTIKTNVTASGKTHFLNRTFSYGTILALTETRIHTSLNGDSDSLNEASARLAMETERQDYSTSPIKEEAIHSLKQKNVNFLQKTSKPSTISENEGHASRSPSSLGLNSTIQPQTEGKKPVILFLIDGLRPDRFMIAAKEGLLPNLAPLFYSRGVEVEIHASRSLTLPSWGTIFTGTEPDFHGLKSNTPASRHDEAITDDFSDGRKELFETKNWVKNRAFQRIEEDATGEAGKVWLPGYYTPEQTVFNYLPIVNGPKSILWNLLSDLISRRDEYTNGIRDHACALDSASSITTASEIEKDSKGKLRLVINWYSAVDEASHYNNRILPAAYREVDQAAGRVLNAARKHPILKDATVFIISDHGHTGGYGPFAKSSLRLSDVPVSSRSEEQPLLINTAFNLTKFLAGEFTRYSDYKFAVGVAIPPEPKFDLSMKNFLLAPYRHVYPKPSLHPTALVDCSGDNIATLYLKGDSKWTRLTYRQLTQFKRPNTNSSLNIISDLLSVQLPNVMVSDRTLASRIYELTENHPVALVATALTGDNAKGSADRLAADEETGRSEREPVLVISRSSSSGDFRTGLILTRTNKQGGDEFRYIVVKNFDQDSSGKILGTPSLDPKDDPLYYLGEVEGTEEFSRWRSDRNWLSRSRKHIWPTAIFTLPRILTLSAKFTDPNLHLISDSIKDARKAEIPDLLLVANPGFSFNGGAPMESDHGGLAGEEVRSSFFVSSLDPLLFSRHGRLSRYPILTRDVMATVLSYAGFGEEGNDPLPKTQGISIKPLLDGRNPSERLLPVK